MKRGPQALVLVILLATLLASVHAFAATDTSPLNVTATVQPTCIITSVTDIDFGTYDPTESALDTDAEGDFTFRCVKDTPYDLYITGTRQMSDGGTETLDFELYTDSTRTSTWPGASPGVTGTAASNAGDTRNVYGRLPRLQDAAPGSYGGSVTITVLY
jgi:spore coat protein U-like protein